MLEELAQQDIEVARSIGALTSSSAHLSPPAAASHKARAKGS